MKSETPGREIAKIAIPVSLEFALILGLNVVNQVVVGGLGTVAVASVGFVNSIILVPMMTLVALGNSTSILVARAYGAKRDRELNTVVSTALISAFVVAGAVSIPLFMWPTELMRVIGASPEVVDMGAEYMAISAISLAPGILSAVFSGILRSADHSRSPMVATLITVALNTPLAIVLVFGFGPIPAMGVVGAAWAAVITTCLKALVLWIQTYGLYNIANWEVPRTWLIWRSLLGALFSLAAPLGVTAIFWTMGNFVYNVVVSGLGDDPLAAMQIVGTMEGVFVVASLGLMSAITALAGRAVGAGDGDLALAWITKIKRIGIYTGVVFGVLFAASSFALSALFPAIAPAVVVMATVGIIANATFQPLKVRAVLLGAAILPSGNDVRGVMMGDFFAPFVVGIPLALALGYLTPLGFYGVIIARLVEEIAKFSLFRWRETRLNWAAIARDQVDAQRAIDETRVTDDPRQGLMQS